MFQFLSIFTLYLAFASGEVVERVLRGDFADPNQFPYIVSLQFKGSHHCGGSIINDRWVLTAKHCTTYSNKNPFSPKDLTVLTGTTSLNSGGKSYQVKRYIVHANYSMSINDLALLELEAPIQFSKSVQKITLSTEEVPYKTKIVVAGWGKTGKNDPISNDLKFTTLKALSQEICGKRVMLDLKEVLCLEHEKDEGVCKGDSGGPAVLNDKLVGVASFIMGDCGGRRPDVYARVSTFIDWIESTMKT